MQLTEARAYCQRNGWDAAEYVDTASGKAGANRPMQMKLMADARLRKFNVVIVWKLDRFGRSLRHLVDSVESLNTWGVRFITLDGLIDTDKRSPMSTLIFQLFAALAQFERELIRERVTAGIKEHKRAAAAGEIGTKRHTRSGLDLEVGRPRLIFRRDDAARMRREGKSWSYIAAKLGVPRSTVLVHQAEQSGTEVRIDLSPPHEQLLANA
jgi:DNA invertase Pin-like site-specific DNA recombinase